VGAVIQACWFHNISEQNSFMDTIAVIRKITIYSIILISPKVGLDSLIYLVVADLKQ